MPPKCDSDAMLSEQHRLFDVTATGTAAVSRISLSRVREFSATLWELAENDPTLRVVIQGGVSDSVMRCLASPPHLAMIALRRVFGAKRRNEEWQ